MVVKLSNKIHKIESESFNLRAIGIVTILLVTLYSCKKNEDDPSPTAVNFNLKTWSVNSIQGQSTNYDVSPNPSIRLRFGAAIDKNTVSSNVTIKDKSGSTVNSNISYADADSTLVVQPAFLLN